MLIGPYLPICDCKQTSKGTCHNEIGLLVQKADFILGSVSQHNWEDSEEGLSGHVCKAKENLDFDLL